MEVNGRHNFIRTGASELVFWKSSHKNAEFEQETISLEEKVDRDREFTYILSKRKLCFLHKCTLYINGFCNSEQFDSIHLDYAYQLIKSVVSHGKYEDNM